MSDIINIEGKKSTPRIIFSLEDKNLLIEGESYPENATSFYGPVINWLKDYLNNTGEGIELKIKLLYVNTSSSKALLVLFDLLEEAHRNGKSSHVHWFYDEENEVACEIGEDLSDGLLLPFTIEKADRFNL